MVDEVTAAPAQEPRNGFHRIPVIGLARRVLAYYWKPCLLDVKQAPGNVQAFSIIKRLIAAAPVIVGKRIDTNDAGARLLDWITATPELDPPLISALLDTRKMLLDYPLKHLPRLGNRRLELFHMMTLGTLNTPTEVQDHPRNLRTCPATSAGSRAKRSKVRVSAASRACALA